MLMILLVRDMMWEISLGFLQATVEFALKRNELKGEFSAYLENVVKDLQR